MIVSSAIASTALISPLKIKNNIKTIIKDVLNYILIPYLTKEDIYRLCKTSKNFKENILKKYQNIKYKIKNNSDGWNTSNKKYLIGDICIKLHIICKNGPINLFIQIYDLFNDYNSKYYKYKNNKFEAVILGTYKNSNDNKYAKWKKTLCIPNNQYIIYNLSLINIVDNKVIIMFNNKRIYIEYKNNIYFFCDKVLYYSGKYETDLKLDIHHGLIKVKFNSNKLNIYIKEDINDKEYKSDIENIVEINKNKIITPEMNNKYKKQVNNNNKYKNIYYSEEIKKYGTSYGYIIKKEPIEIIDIVKSIFKETIKILG